MYLCICTSIYLSVYLSISISIHTHTHIPIYTCIYRVHPTPGSRCDTFIDQTYKRYIYIFVYLSCHTHTHKRAERGARNIAGAEALAVARRPEVASREKNPAAAGIRRFFPLREGVK